MSVLKGITNYGDPLVSDQLKFNCYNFMDWGLLNIGAFTNVKFPSGAFSTGIGSHSVEPYILRMSRDPRYPSGKVWEGFRNNWVWESGLNYQYQPVSISGVYVNNNFISKNTSGASGFKIVYPEGRIIFNSALPTTSQIKCEFSYKNVRIALSDAPWWQTLQFDSYRADDIQFKQTAPSGAWDVLSSNRIQLPAIVIDSVPRVLVTPYEMGNLSRNHKQEIAFHILSETAYERDQLHDILINQWESTIAGIDKKKVTDSGKMPLNYDGTINISGMNYQQLQNSIDFEWRGIRWEQVRSAEIQSKIPLYRAQVNALLTVQLF